MIKSVIKEKLIALLLISIDSVIQKRINNENELN